jgi:hypothetical protein
LKLAAYSGLPASGGRAQLDLITADLARLRRIAKRNGWR